MPPRHHNPNPKCPIRFGEPCTACQPGTSGPNDCQLVQLVREDPDLKELMVEMISKKRTGKITSFASSGP